MTQLGLRNDLIDRDWYRDPEIFNLEQERIFRRVWHYACVGADVAHAGDFATLTVAGQPIIVLRGKDGALRAFLNACTHRGTALTEDCIGSKGNCGAALQCMYHAWTFDTTGRLIGVPHPEAYGPDFDREALGLVEICCRTFGSLVFVAIDPLRPTIADYLGDAAEWVEPAVQDVEIIGRASWTYEGNWKLWHENFRDNYHPPFVHRNVRNLDPKYSEDGANYALPPGHSMLRWPVKPRDYERYSKSLAEVAGFPVDALKALTALGPRTDSAPWRQIVALFPNMDYQQFGARASGLQVCNPLGVSKTRVDIIYLAPIGEDQKSREYRLRTVAQTTGCWGETSVDDNEAAERTTIGVRSRGTRCSNMGRGTAPGLVGETSDEYSLREFYREYRHYLFEG